MFTGPGTSSCRGFTLLETLVAMALLAMALTFVGRLVLTSRQSLELSLSRSRAHQQADALLTALQALPDGHVWLEEGVILHPGGGGMRLQGTVQSWPGKPTLGRIEVNASWDRTGGGQGQFQLRGLRRSGGRP